MNGFVIICQLLSMRHFPESVRSEQQKNDSTNKSAPKNIAVLYPFPERVRLFMKLAEAAPERWTSIHSIHKYCMLVDDIRNKSNNKRLQYHSNASFGSLVYLIPAPSRDESVSWSI